MTGHSETAWDPVSYTHRRDKHHVELTAAGKVYLNEARAILVRAEEAAKLARTAAEGVAGELTIGFIRGYEQSRFSETLRSFHEAYPKMCIRDRLTSADVLT